MDDKYVVNLEKIQKALEAAHGVAEVNTKSNVPQCNYIMEECAEYIKAVMKVGRGKDTPEHAFEEAMDIVAAVMVWMDESGVPFDTLMDHVINKCQRAIDRYDDHAEV